MKINCSIKNEKYLIGNEMWNCKKIMSWPIRYEFKK